MFVSTSFAQPRALARLATILGILFTGFVTGCFAQQPQSLPVDPVKLLVMGQNGSQKTEFEIEIAADARQRRTGLMHRVDLPRDRGMLFVFEEEKNRAFWMKNTPSSLDIIYIDANGIVVSIARAAVPFSTAAIPSNGPAKYVLEVLSGVADEVGIVVGDQMVHTRIGVADQ